MTVTWGVSHVFFEVNDVLQTLDEAGFVLGAISHATSAPLEAMLEAARRHFRGTIWGADNAERFDKDAQRYRSAAGRAGVTAENCLVVDTSGAALLEAKQAGMRTARLCWGAAGDGTRRICAA